ncbi:MAG: site-specific integrase [Pirellulales bacterium]|nr:site-specific integrase [Pirellulales bacterium]
MYRINFRGPVFGVHYTQKVLEHCPDAQWRLIFALARFGGLRTPSETLALRWGHIDWERGRITIISPKTAHFDGKESRQIPLFPELRPYLEEVYEQAAPGSEWVITRYRGGNTNLRTQLQRIIGRAGLQCWPKLFQNLRSTRETELAKDHPIHVVCAWLGNSPVVAAKHYLQVTDADYEQESSGTESGTQAAQNAAQQPAASLRDTSHKTAQLVANQGVMLNLATSCADLQECSVTPTGFEPVLPA